MRIPPPQPEPLSVEPREPDAPNDRSAPIPTSPPPFGAPITGAGLPEIQEFVVVNPPGQPLRNARLVAEALFQRAEDLVLRAYRGNIYRWTGQCWVLREDAWLTSVLYLFFENACYIGRSRSGKKRRFPFDPTKFKIGNVLGALTALLHLNGRIDPPIWLGDDPGPPPNELVPVANGLLHLPTRKLLEHTPRFFSLHAAPVAYDADAVVPSRWLEFLTELWGDDVEAIETFQEMFGYFLSGDTSQQKIFMLVGPKRSGKSTISRVLRALVGSPHVAGPTLDQLTRNFGMQSLIGKSLAIIADARLSGQRDTQIVVERLLSISGEDALDIDRKYRDPWTGRVPARLFIISNELPALIDPSGALASRFIILPLTRSFYGEEDTELTDKLIAELPGILNWALDGLDRLRARGRFIQPESGKERIQELEDLSSPVGVFVRERCVVAP